MRLKIFKNLRAASINSKFTGSYNKKDSFYYGKANAAGQNSS